MRIADASVWINLIATERAHVILRATPVPLRITDVALAELERGRSKGRQAADEMAALLHMGLTDVVALAAEDEALFVSLVSGPAAETLDDGEAATLACELMLVMGSSLAVYPAAGFPLMAKRGGARLAILNRDETPQDRFADLVVNAGIGPTMRAVIDLL